MKRMMMLMALVLVLVPSLVAADQIKQVVQPNEIPSFLGYVQDEFIVVMKPELSEMKPAMANNAVVHIGDTEFDKISERFAVSRIKQQFAGAKAGALSKTAELAKYHKVKIETGTLEEAMDAYRRHPMVERVEPIGIHAMYATPNDGYFQYQWYHNQASDHDIDSPEAWDMETGNPAVVLALLDSGTRYYHPDLGGINGSPTNPAAARGNMWINWAEKNGSAGVDDDGNGYVDDWIGYDFIDGVSNCWTGEDCTTKDNDPRDFNGHGTHTAGIMGMLTNDGYGMAGVAGGWGNGSQAETGNGVKIMPLRMGYSYNYYNQEYGVVMMDAAAEAFYYAANNGARIASCSWGSSNSGGIGAAVDYFLNAGGMVFVAAGNDGSQTADYLNGRGDLISVAATDQNDAAASFTTYGTWVDICAPGVGIYSTYHDHTDPNTNYWASMDGTSMATPMAAAVGGLIWSHNPTWTAAQVKSQLFSSADNIDAYLSSTYIGKMGAGRINSYNAVNTGPPPPPVADFSGTPRSGTEPLTVIFTDLSTGNITDWSWTFGDGGTSTAQNPTHQYTSAGTYNVSLTVTGPGGSDGETKNGYIVVDPCVPPTAGFVGAPLSGDYALVVSFTDQSSGATSRSWNFGDGGTSTAVNPSHTYTAAGVYTVTQTVTNTCGSDQMVRTNYITVTTPQCDLPVADFTGSPTGGDYPLVVSFADLTTNAPTSWSWTFGDGGTSTAQNPSHTYTAEGTYTVTLTATNACGSDGETKTGYITVTTPTVAYAALPYSTGFESGAFDQYWYTYSNNAEGRILITSSYTPHTGSYHMTMDDNYNGGLYAQNEAWLRLNLAGKADVDLVFWWKEFGDETHTQDGVYFSNNGGSSFTKVYSLVDGSTTYQEITLDVDQLAASAGLSLTGTFVVKFQQYDNYSITTDGMAFDDISVISYETPPVADFSGTPTSGSYPLTVNFSDLSTGIPTAWSWNFGDGQTSTAQNPSHVYTTVGLYTVSLTATNAFGNDTETKTAYINVTEPSEWTVITYDDFEGGMGNYTDGGGDMSLYTYGTYAHQGSRAADIQDNSGVASSFYHTAGYNVSGYTELEVDFWFVAISMDNTTEDFWVQYYDGSVWQTVAALARGIDFDNNVFYHVIVSISNSEFNFPTNARLRFMCDASNNLDDVYIDEIEFRGMSGTSSMAKGEAPLPEEFALAQNYPNPFNPATTIDFSLPVASNVVISIYNILGQEVARVADGHFDAGVHSVEWNAGDKASGVYLYRIKANDFVKTRKMLLLK